MKHYRIDILVTVAVVAVMAVTMGALAAFTVAVLATLEWTVSFDNAVVNAKYLGQMSPQWQRVFMTVGLAIAVVGMRFIYPILVVAGTAKMNVSDVVTLALKHPHLYQVKLDAAGDLIAVFGGIYLLLIALDFFFDEREVKWIKPCESALCRIGSLDERLKLAVPAAIIVLIGVTAPNGAKLALVGVISMVLYNVVSIVADFFDGDDEEDEVDSTGAAHPHLKVGAAALALFLYLEVQDAAFSFDGVAGAFAITDKVIVIAAGLGLGAMYVRTMTVQLVRHGTIGEFRYLEHGAYWAIIVLAVCILGGIYIAIPDFLKGCFGITFVGAALYHSWRLNKQDEASAPAEQVHNEPKLVQVGAES